MTTATTDDRVAEALRGDEDALHELVAHWLPTVYGWCNRLGAADPQEAATDVLLILVRRHARINGPDHLPAWLYTTTRRVVANQNKKAWWRRWLPGVALDGWASPLRTDLPLEQREIADRVSNALDTLDPNHREVLVLCYLEERSVHEAAELIGIPPGTVKSRLFAARSRFEQVYGKDEP